MKKLKTVAIVLIGVILIGAVYETIISYFTIRSRDALISSLESDYENIADRLAESEDRVVDLKGTVEKLRLGSAELERELEVSDRIRGDLWNENQRLGGFLSEGQDSAGKLTGIHRELGESIDRAWEIIERYEVGTEEESGGP